MITTPALRVLLFLMLSAGLSLSQRGASRAYASPQTVLSSGEKPIDSKRTNGMAVVLANESGKLSGGKNPICVLLQDITTGGPADVQDVSLKFTLRVGRISGEPIAAQLNRDGPGRYCGHVDLGRQYYDPASYFVEMHYTNTIGKKRKLSFWVIVK